MRDSARAKMPNLLKSLLSSDFHTFPATRGKLEVPTEQGVYVIYDNNANVLHVGKTSRGKQGLKQRLGDHIGGTSSFKDKYLKPNGLNLVGWGTFRYLVVTDAYERAAFEAYTIGNLCPDHIGLNKEVLKNT